MGRFAPPGAGRLIDMRLIAFRRPLFAFVLLAAGSLRAAPPTPPAGVPERVAHLRELLERPSWICSAILGSVRRSCRIRTARCTVAPRQRRPAR